MAKATTDKQWTDRQRIGYIAETLLSVGGDEAAPVEKLTRDIVAEVKRLREQLDMARAERGTWHNVAAAKESALAAERTRREQAEAKAAPDMATMVRTVEQILAPDSPFEYDHGDVVITHYDDIYDLRRRAEQAEQLLRECEWATDCEEEQWCLVCGNLRSFGHKADCRIAVLLHHGRNETAPDRKS